MVVRRFAVCAVVSLLAGCYSADEKYPPPADDSSIDSTATDTSIADADPTDTGAVDTGTPDTATPDTGAPDTEVADTADSSVVDSTTATDADADADATDDALDAADTAAPIDSADAEPADTADAAIDTAPVACEGTATSCGAAGSCVSCTASSLGHVCVSESCGCNVAADCPEAFACDPVSHTCTSSCSGTRPCSGSSCCSSTGTCVAGTSDSACGGSGLCTDCTAVTGLCSDITHVAAAGTCGSGKTCSYATGTACANGCYRGVCNTSAPEFKADATSSTSGVTLVKIANLDPTTGTAPAGTAVTVTVPTAPHAGVAVLKLNYTTDNFATTIPLTMTFTGESGSNDLWTATVPAVTAGTVVRFYLELTPHTGAAIYMPGMNVNYTYQAM